MPFDTPSAAGRSSSRERQEANDAELNRQRFAPKRHPLTPERWRLLVRGHVQGVGYRAACKRRATELGLAGWVRNCADGSVEIQAEGVQQHLAELRVWCEAGPTAARVDSVLTSMLAPTGADWFEIRPSQTNPSQTNANK
ncbi:MULTISPECIES: acylphosphatase [Synechococcus]|jgi:acylphosphatase|uniref:acylphosphatase n=1 Tax=Synechococcus lacustris str. Tous TaxID=1910958 RepID=A0A2P7ECC0_9SYNE|nr:MULTISPECIES: acylphosphatase [Synechococcus]HBU26508.1 acylphosphatase [Synechococcales bacterium UBA8138]MCP9794436.1 acylphosphatase [Synechococcus lacustris L1F-Slac]MCP9814595.1 acylphosphatase [Synechococcus lacustris L1E-Slac]MCP9922755.1 acylphosphatase [Synechococcus lacustris Cruz CV12-2]MCP9924549.1 acylphosphatase [Synechococcus lacustris C3-12m-Tous]